MDDCFKIDMGCDCAPPAPDRPRPFVFSWLNQQTEGSGAQINFTSSGGAITGYTIVSVGQGYRIAPTITIGGAGIGATATCTVNLGKITSVTITAGGSGYGSTSGITSTLTAGKNNAITLDQTFTPLNGGFPFKFYPLQRVSLVPAGGGNITLTTGKVNMKIVYTVKTNGATNFTGRFTVNGVAVATLMTIDNSNEIYTTVSHQSGELTLNYTDYISYEISSTASNLFDITSCIGNFSIKYI